MNIIIHLSVDDDKRKILGSIFYSFGARPSRVVTLIYLLEIREIRNRVELEIVLLFLLSLRRLSRTKVNVIGP